MEIRRSEFRDIPCRISYWLIPSEPFFSKCRQIICDFATRFNGPEFTPHVALYFGRHSSAEALEETLTTFSRIPAPSLTVKGLIFTEQFKKSCAVDFERSSVFEKMSEVIKVVLKSPEAYQVVPHMSLFYGELSSEEREAIYREISLPRSVSFDVVSAIALSEEKTTSRKNVEEWKEIARTAFIGESDG